ncbi:MAG TPA: thiamine pyrophosphate-binding protein [Edaphobacter sp.]|jgi:indolepyruvate decarboxylase|nr:thiamine pyrophosphate-binding protein [Edaphobacter sp.]
MTVAQYLLSRLTELGIRHLFGVPGDFNLWFLEEALNHSGIEFVGCCNELNASYAADGYARVSGIAAIATTYGVGELAAIAGIAGAFAEKLPVVCITGTPPLTAMEEHALIHHTLGDGNYENMMNCYREFTVAQARLTATNAAHEIDRVLAECLRQKRPVYLQLPSDIAGAEILERPTVPLPLIFPGDPQQTHRAAQELAQLLNQAEKAAILIDVDVDRFGLLPSVLKIAETRNIPIAHVATARGILSDSDPRNIGWYRGAASAPEVKQAVEDADLLLCLGVRLTDVATGLFSHNLTKPRIVNIESSSTNIAGQQFLNVTAKELLDETLKQLLPHKQQTAERSPLSPTPDASKLPDSALNQEIFWTIIQSFIRPGDILISDTGTAGFASAGLRMPEDVRVLAQPIWGALGYGLPATLGACSATDQRRVILFVGDGGLQMSVQELSTLLWRGLKPIIFLLNNDGYTIERLIYGPNSQYNNIARWSYLRLPEVFEDGEPASTQSVKTTNELMEALSSTQHQKACHLIEVILPRMDALPSLVKFARKAAEFDFPQLIESTAASRK